MAAWSYPDNGLNVLVPEGNESVTDLADDPLGRRPGVAEHPAVPLGSLGWIDGANEPPDAHG
jgi:hypothetical protein